MTKDLLKAPIGRVTLRQLRALEAVVRDGTLAAAAETLAVTPPAVSLQLHQLEDLLGAPLLERTQGGARPTAAGQEVLAACQRIQLALADCAEALVALRSADTGRVAVGVISTAKYFAPRALAAFRRAHPRIELKILVGNRQDTIAALEGFDLDFAVMGRPPEHFSVEQAVIGDHPHVIIAPPDHPLVGRPGLSLHELSAETFLLRETGSGTRLLVQRLFAGAGLEPTVGMEIGSNETIKQAVMAGMGIALISQHTIGLELGLGMMTTLSVEGFPLMRSWFVAHRRNMPLLPVHARLRAFLLENGQAIIDELDREHRRIGALAAQRSHARPQRKARGRGRA